MKTARRAPKVSSTLRAKAQFLNVDLDIKSPHKLDALATAMGKAVMVLYSGPIPRKENLLAVEISGFLRSPDATIHALCNVIEKLASAERQIWDKAQKVFDVGCELRPTERSSRFTLRTDTLQRIASLGATFAVTYYRGDVFEK